MIRPAPALLWIAGVIWVPAAVCAAVLPNLAFAIWAGLASFCIVSVVDLAVGRTRLRPLSASADDDVQLAQGRQQRIEVRLRKPLGIAGPLRAGLNLPPSFECENEEIDFDIESNQQEYALQWPIAARERGRYLDRKSTRLNSSHT